jgi:hypothetical protein
MLNKFSKEMESGAIGYTDLSVSSTEIVFKVLRERNRDKIFEDFVKQLKEAITGTISFETTVVDVNQKVMIKPIDVMLLDTYKMFTSVNEKMLQEEINKVSEVIEEYHALEKIREPLTTCIGKKFNIEQTVDGISEITQIPKEIIKELISKYRIQKLLTLDTDTSELKIKKEEFQDKLKNIEKFVLEQYNVIS